MSVLQKVRILSNERLDKTDWDRMQEFVCADFAQLFNKFFADQPYIIKGFEVNNPRDIIGTLTSSGITIEIANSVLFHGLSDTGGAFFAAPADAESQAVSLTANATNYIEMEMTIETGTPDNRAFWDADRNIEYNQIIDTVQYLDVIAASNTVGFTDGRIPIAKIVTSGATPSIITSITDCRELFYRLGAGGSLPAPQNSYNWPEVPYGYGRVDSPVTVTGTSPSTVNPFKGSDKNIRNFKDWMNAVMTRIKEISGEPYWFKLSGGSTSFSLAELWWDAVGSVMTGNGNFVHSPAGTLSWTSTIYVKGIIGPYYFTIPSSSVALADDQIAYVIQVRNVNIPSISTGGSVTFTNGANYVNSGTGSAGDFVGLAIGDWIKNVVDSSEYYARIVDFKAGLDGLGGSVAANVALSATISPVYGGTDGTAVTAVYSKGNYGIPDILIGNRNSMPNNSNVWWLAIREDNGGPKALIYLRNDAELEDGESKEIGDETPLELLAYIGSTSEADSTPDYVVSAPDTKSGQTSYNAINGESLTQRASKVTSMVADKAQDKTIRVREGGTFDWDLGTNTLTWDSGIVVQIPSSANNNTIASGSSVIDTAGKCAYFTIDRNALSALVLTVDTEDNVPLNENTFILAHRGADDRIYLFDGTVCEDGVPTGFGLSHLWTRIGTVLSPYNTGDDIDLGTGELTAELLLSKGLNLDDAGVSGGRISFDVGGGTTNYLECYNDGSGYDWYLNNGLGFLEFHGDLDILEDGGGNGGNLSIDLTATIGETLNVGQNANISANANIGNDANIGRNIGFGANPQMTSSGGLEINLDIDDDSASVFKILSGFFGDSYQYAYALPKELLKLDEVTSELKNYGDVKIGTGTGCAVGTMTFTLPPIVTETFTLNGTVHTIVASASGADEISLGTSAAEQGNFVASDFNQYSSEKDNCFAVSDNLGNVKFIWKVPGVAGNAIVFTELLSNCTVDGAGVLGGTVAGFDDDINVYVYKEGQISIGLSGDRVSRSSGSHRGEEIHIEHSGLGAGEYLRGLMSYAYVNTSGNATAYAQSLRGHLGLEAGGLLSEAYGAYISVTQADGSKIADHAYGILGHVNLLETDLADLPTGMVTGVLGLYDVQGTDPNITLAAGTAFMAALSGVVARESKAPHAGVISVLQGDSASDIAVPAAFKAVAERTTAGKGFNYGIDFKTEAGLCENINTADIRGSKANILKNIAVDIWETDALFKATDKGIKTKPVSANLGGAAPVEADCVTAFGSLPNDGYVGVLVDSSNTTLTYAIFAIASKYNYIALTQL